MGAQRREGDAQNGLALEKGCRRWWCANKANVIFSALLLIPTEDTQVYYECDLRCPCDAADLRFHWSESEPATKIIYLQS